jgi:hypothetical protein
VKVDRKSEKPLSKSVEKAENGADILEKSALESGVNPSFISENTMMPIITAVSATKILNFKEWKKCFIV